MGWSERQDRLQNAVYASLGLDATWTGADEPVRVILRDQDSVMGMAVVDVVTVRVRQREVANPAQGDQVEITQDGRRFEIVGSPLLDRKRNWQCEAAPLPAEAP